MGCYNLIVDYVYALIKGLKYALTGYNESYMDACECKTRYLPLWVKWEKVLYNIYVGWDSWNY